MGSRSGGPVAVVDDEPDIRNLVELHLHRAGFETVSFENGTEFQGWLTGGGSPSLCILDIMLPDIQGTDLCRRIRSSPGKSDTPIIMLTALGHETDRVTGLELGADDYVTKPFSPRELVARVRAVLRRTGGKDTHRDEASVISLGPLEMDTEAFVLKVNGRKVFLTSTEFRLLRVLLEGRGKVYSRSRLLDVLWGGEKFVFERTVDVHISHIRDKIGPASELIQNVRGVGYRAGEPEK